MTPLEALAVVLVLGILYLGKPATKKGKITVGPGKGVVKILTGWRPRKAKIRFCKQPPIPGCSQLKDKAKVHQLLSDGFTIKYDIESGPRTIRWKAYKAICKK